MKTKAVIAGVVTGAAVIGLAVVGARIEEQMIEKREVKEDKKREVKEDKKRAITLFRVLKYALENNAGPNAISRIEAELEVAKLKAGIVTEEQEKEAGLDFEEVHEIIRNKNKKQ